jgi:hypothetical protein
MLPQSKGVFMDYDSVGDLIGEARKRLQQADGNTNLEMIAVFDGLTAGLLGVIQELKEVRRAIEASRDVK